MPSYSVQVVNTITIGFTVNVKAKDEGTAAEKVQAMIDAGKLTCSYNPLEKYECEELENETAIEEICED